MATTKPATLYTALLAAQAEMGPVLKDKTNPAFRSKYADLDAVLDAVRGPLNDNGLILTQPLTDVSGRLVLVTQITHADTGSSITSAAEVRCADPDNPQKVGSAITYYRRYSLLALLGLAPEDDDGQSASQPRRQDAPVTHSEPQQDVKAAPRTNHIPKNAPMLTGNEVIAGYLTSIEHAADYDALYKIGAEMTAAGISDEVLKTAYDKRKAAFQSTT